MLTVWVLNSVLAQLNLHHTLHHERARLRSIQTENHTRVTESSSEDEEGSVEDDSRSESDSHGSTQAVNLICRDERQNFSLLRRNVGSGLFGGFFVKKQATGDGLQSRLGMYSDSCNHGGHRSSCYKKLPSTSLMSSD